ncbi:hypothetical protein B566_EDAN014069 [Ephemera danica]|nr:hypothetical protein B566_EDAN014069 [Ephemera danica]
MRTAGGGCSSNTLICCEGTCGEHSVPDYSKELLDTIGRASVMPPHCNSVVLMVILIAVTSALPSSLLHDADQADRSAAKVANTEGSSPSSSTPPVPVKTAAKSLRAKEPAVAAPLQSYKLHSGGLSKRNENSVLKREQQLRFPGVTARNKRDLPSRLDTDDALALLALWASAASAPPHHLRFADTDLRYDIPDLPDDEMMEDGFQRQDQEQLSDGWGGEEEYGDRLNVMRRAGPQLYPFLPSFQRRSPASELGWGEFAAPAHKRFMVSKRRVPQNDVYSLAQLLSDRPESPYRRIMY